MTFFYKGALALALAASTGLLSDGGIGMVSATPTDTVVSESEAVQPVDMHVDLTKSLIVSYADEKGKQNLAQHASKKKMKVKRNMDFKKAHKLKPAASASNGSNNGNDKGKNKGKGRNLQLVEDGAEASGISILEFEGEDGDLEATMAELMAVDGVTSVEEDSVMHIESMEYQQKLRGGGGGGVAGHARDIQDAIKAAMSEFPGEEIEFSPNFFEGDTDTDGVVLHHHPERRLAESTPYGINMVNVTHLWSKTPAAPITICVVDTGYDLGHEDLPTATGWHQVNSDGSTPFGLWDVDGHGHGTHCAGTIGAIGNDKGVVGVNPDPDKFNFVIGKGLSDSGSGSTSNVMEAVNQCVIAGAKVVSMSLGGTGQSSTVQAFYEDQYDQNVLIIAAAGNSGADSWGYPAGYPSVMSVGSVMESGSASSFTTRNNQVEISAPGHYVYSTHKGNSYTTMSGTSMATPHVAGVAALLWSNFPDCTNNQIRNAMINSVVDPPASAINVAGWDKYYGWGTVNAGLAYELLSKGCEVAGGAANPPVGEGLSYFAQGGKDQKNLGCTMDSHCAQFNPCLGEHVCSAGTCVQVPGTAPVCDDGKKCTIDTCDPSRPLNDLCVYTPKPCEDGNKCNGIMACDEETGSCFEQEPAVNCEDFNACTVDSCNPSTGVCSNVPKTCDDNNACTFGDTCDPTVGCIFAEPEPNCCGNAECEAGETETSCPVDCGTTLTTSFDPAKARYDYLGSIFDIATKSKNLTIVGMDLNCQVPEGLNSKVFVYSLEGGDYYADGSWYKRERWQLVADQSINCQGFGQPTTVIFDKQVHVGKNSRHAFNYYVYTDNAATGYWFSKSIYPPSGMTARYSVVDEDSYLQIMTGSGNRCISGYCAISSPMLPSTTIHYGVVNDSPTTSPTISSMPSTPVPTLRPTTKAPTENPTETPTDSPSVSLAPTPFEPIKVTVATPPTNSAYTLNSLYFDVTGGVNDSVITNMKVATYASTSVGQMIRVFVKRGVAAGSEAIPCDWQLVAETGNEPTGYWKHIYPKWTEPFKPVELFAGETVSFYVWTDQKLLGQSASSSLKYTSYMTTDNTSVLPGISMSYGATATNDLFRPNPSYYSARSFMGALDLETVAPGSTMSPTSAPTEKFSSYQVESSLPAAESTFHGIQFDIKTTKNIVLRGLSMYVESGTHFMEVWYRVGSHKGSSSGCDHHNNWCNQWVKAAGADITSAGKESLTSSPPLSIIVSAGQTIAIAVTLPKSLLTAGTARAIAEDDADDVLTIVSSGSQINDYYGQEVNTIHALDPAPVDFKGVIDYDVTHSFCATISAEYGILSDFGPDEPDEVFNPNGPQGDGGPGQGPVDEDTDGFDSLS